MVRMITRQSGPGGQDAPGGLQAVQLRHPDVHQHDVRAGARAAAATASAPSAASADDRRSRRPAGSSGSRCAPAPGRRRSAPAGPSWPAGLPAHAGGHPAARPAAGSGPGPASRRPAAAPHPASPPYSATRSRRPSRPRPAAGQAAPDAGAAVVATSTMQRARLVVQSDLVAGCPGVLHHVGQRLLHHPVGGQVQARRQRPGGSPATRSSTGRPAVAPGRSAG